MRDSFIKELSTIAKSDRNVLLVTGDLGFGVLDRYRKDYPKQFINAGVAEQNMTGLATGLAMEGKTVFTYSICNFPTIRCLEQIRNDACYHNANLKIVAIGCGFCYGSLGISHHATEDLAIMRALPNITVIAPGDTIEAKYATRAVYEASGTCYLRLGRGNEPKVHTKNISFQIGKAIEIINGKDVIIISTGGILNQSLRAAKQLKRQGYDIGFYSMHTVKPIDKHLIEKISKKAKVIITVEEHSVVGGLGGAVAEVMAKIPDKKAYLKMVGLKKGFSSIVGDQQYLRNMYRITEKNIIDIVKKI